MTCAAEEEAESPGLTYETEYAVRDSSGRITPAADLSAAGVLIREMPGSWIVTRKVYVIETD